MFAPEQLHVVTVISNPQRYKRRYELYREFAKRVADAGATLWTVELAFGERPHAVTDSSDPHHIQVTGSHELWLKENLMNLGVARLPSKWEYVALIDADLNFVRSDWATETIHQLQHHPVVQMYSEVSHLSPLYESLGKGVSFVEAWNQGKLLKTTRGQAKNKLYFHPKQVAENYPAGRNSELGSPGGAWAYRRDAFDALGGMIDYSLVGSGDYFMAAGLYGLMDLVIADGYHPRLVQRLMDWQNRALRNIRKNVGVVHGLVLHYWHGKMSQRGYGDRWRILIDCQFNPDTDIVYDSQGVLRLEDDHSERFRQLRDDLRAYFRSRNEDSIDVQ